MRDLLEACKYRPADDEEDGDSFTGSGALMELKLEDFDLDTAAAARVIQLFQRHSQTLETLALDQCSGYVDLVVTIALTTLPKLKTLSLAIGRISPTGFDPYASALGVTLQNNNSMRQLTLKAGSNVFFTLSTEAARSLAHGLSQNSMLERFELIGCRFEDAFALTSLSRGLRTHCFLKQVCIKSCFQSNGHVLGDTAMAELLFAIGEHNRQLHMLDLRGNQCHSAAMTAVAKLLYRTSLRRLNLSSQCVRIASSDPRHDNADGDDEDGDDSYSGQQNIFMDLSLLVAALGRTNTLRELELRYNCLDDSDVAYLAAALKQNTSIQYLGLASNRISNVGISILATEIPYFQGLRRLDLTNNQYDGNGLVELACAMRDNKSIESVQLDNTDCYAASSSSRAQLDSIASWKVIRYYGDLNASGRRHLNQPSGGRRIIDALWPLVLSRASSKLQDTAERTEREADIFFAFLRHHPNIFRT
jgi:hypothetical protein